MKVTLDDRADGSQFGADITQGEPTVGSILIISTPDDRDRRVYRVLAINGNVLAVEREPISVGIFV